MEKKNVETTTSFDGFIQRCDLNDQELLAMCDTIFTQEAHYPFHLEPAKNIFDGFILVYEPTSFGLLLTRKAYDYFIPWIEKTKFYDEPYDTYLNWKNAVEKDD